MTKWPRVGHLYTACMQVVTTIVTRSIGCFLPPPLWTQVLIGVRGTLIATVPTVLSCPVTIRVVI